ncbi:D-alanyl-D-alanine carboxypeptidase/D-alanyl-D-alanine-endopeptidase [Streptomyces sp. IB2014 016-6]|uniref:D-alanyl-D-alanine carboxypeptidase/D-alanyl-D-alanine endopeptidase n=1 Tax=Streptomyces sp. IB2014 016-6 TaxID=2517818 RepID=UPI0011C8321A|nr:D-alanyl-D-alanine carboxypeptidase/D-alanyl-D-alanine-endopeptidase [Streptomyces sp. IB2014 016-6]TXL84824.1 D-alanyl-D-alanine carboxypeptidase/D-alanyl-D-alanine-endopeptidase [Streptomyces sp. IB2014 016-6]
MLEPKVWQLTAGSAVFGLVLAAGAVALAGPWDSGQRKAEREWAAAQGPTGGAHHDGERVRVPASAPSAAGVLAELGVSAESLSAPADLPGDLTKTLGPLLESPDLGPAPAASVVDVATGEQLFGQRADRPMAPASTIKIATAVAALSALGPDHRIPTTVVTADGGKGDDDKPGDRPAGESDGKPGNEADGKGEDPTEITLVGGGDATLDRAGLRSLAAGTARALRDRGVHRVSVRFDVSLYSGPREHPIGPNDNIAPVTALMAGQGRLDGSAADSFGGPAPRSGDPAGDAADVFADLLRERGLKTSGAPAAGKAPQDADRLAVTYSRPVSSLVERMLTNSDNDIAESLVRQTAIEAGRPASFAGAQQAVQAELKKLKLPVDGALLRDGSGLNRHDRLTSGLLTALLARAADPDRPELRPVLTGLPVAGFSGTLQGRYTDADATTGSGLIRAKTGTLTGVNSLAGTVVGPGGRLLAFAFLAEDAPAPDTAQRALDHLSAELVS